MKILLIEDDKAVAAVISTMLKSQGIICEHEINGNDGFEAARLCEYDAIILDMILPDFSGAELLSRLRACDIKTPVLILSCMSDPNYKIKALSTGADDYIAKPFDKQELLARVNAVIRRSNGYSSSVLKIGRLSINLQQKTASVDNNYLSLTKKEYNMLELLARRKGAVLNKDAFLDHLYDSDCDEPTKKIVDVFICKLRSKIKAALQGDEENIPEIETVWGRGYKLVLRNKSEENHDDVQNKLNKEDPFRRKVVDKNIKDSEYSEENYRTKISKL